MGFDWFLNFAYTIILNHSSSAHAGDVDRAVPCPGVGNREEMEKAAGRKYGRSGFQMPLHYPRYLRSDYEKMEEWKVDVLLKQYGLECRGNLEEKRKFAMGAFLWPDQF